MPGFARSFASACISSRSCAPQYTQKPYALMSADKNPWSRSSNCPFVRSERRGGELYHKQSVRFPDCTLINLVRQTCAEEASKVITQAAQERPGDKKLISWCHIMWLHTLCLTHTLRHTHRIPASKICDSCCISKLEFYLSLPTMLINK